MPWEPGYWGVGGIRIPFETDVTPDPGPLEYLRLIWPERYVVWNVMHQMWEVRQFNPVTCQDERVELLYRMVQAPGGGRVPGYLPFNYEWLYRRAKNRQEFLALGPEKYDDLVQARNQERSRSVMRDAVREMAAGFRELIRYPGPGKWVPVGGIIRPARLEPAILLPSPSNGKGY